MDLIGFLTRFVIFFKFFSVGVELQCWKFSKIKKIINCDDLLSTGILEISTILAKPAPWVVLDSRRDMIAMSSEVTEDIATVQTIAVPPTTTVDPILSNDEEVVTSEPDKESVTEPQVELDVVKSEADMKSIPVDENKPVDVVEQTTTTEELVQSDAEEVVEVTTVTVTTPAVSTSSLAPTADLKKDDVEVPAIPMPPVKPNPNTIGQDAPPGLIETGKKIHEVVQGFLKKTKVF